MYLAVVRAYPNDTGRLRRLRYRGDRAEGHPAGVEAAAIIVSSQVGAYALPFVALVERPEQHLRSGVDDLWVVRRQQNRRRPVVAQCVYTLGHRWPDRRRPPGFLVETALPARLQRVVYPARVCRVNLVVHAVAGAHGRPILERDQAASSIARTLPGFVVLQTGIDVVRIVHIDADGVDLADRDVEVIVGALSAVVRDVHSTIGAEHDALWILVVPPHGAEVTEDAAEEITVPGGPAIARLVHRVAVDDDVARIDRVGQDLVEGIGRLRAGNVDAIAMRLRPTATTVFRAVDLVADGPTADLAIRGAGVVARWPADRPRIDVLDHGMQHA